MSLCIGSFASQEISRSTSTACICTRGGPGVRARPCYHLPAIASLDSAPTFQVAGHNGKGFQFPSHPTACYLLTGLDPIHIPILLHPSIPPISPNLTPTNYNPILPRPTARHPIPIIPPATPVDLRPIHLDASPTHPVAIPIHTFLHTPTWTILLGIKSAHLIKEGLCIHPPCPLSLTLLTSTLATGSSHLPLVGSGQHVMVGSD